MAPSPRRQAGKNGRIPETLFAEYVRTRDPGTRTALIDAHQPLVRFLAGKFANRGEPLEDLVSVGSIGLVKAVDRFDPERGVKFSTFATPTIVGEIRRYFRDSAWGLKVPRRLQELNRAASKASADLQQTLGRSPSVAEIGAAIGATEEDTLAALELASAYDPVSVDAPVGDDESASPEEAIGADDEEFGKLELRSDVTNALGRLGEREREILTLRFFYNMSQAEVARRLKISQMHVSRLQSKALARLKKLLDG